MSEPAADQELARVFVVGCSRSGTTIIQSLMAREFQLWTLPETRFFNFDLTFLYGRVSALSGLYYAIHHRRRGNRLVDLSRVLRFLLRSIGLKATLGALSSAPLTTRAFQELLDHEAGRAGAHGWLEKTPKHFRQMARIRKLVSQPRFIFVVRNGEDVVASLRDRYNRNPEDFLGEGDVRHAIELWNESMLCLMQNQDQPDVRVLCYESWVADPDREFAELVGFLRLPRGDSRTGDHNLQITREHEMWKQITLDKIVPAESKFAKLFSDRERAAIRAQLRVDLYQQVCPGWKTGPGG